MGSVFDLDRLRNYHDRCTKCMMSCYRDASVLMHAGVAAVDAATMAADGHARAAVQTFFNKSVALSLRSAWATKRQIRSLSQITVRRKAVVKLRQTRDGFDDAARLGSVSADEARKKPENRDLECGLDVEPPHRASC